MSSCLLGRLCQDTVVIQEASCVVSGLEQKGKNLAMIEKQGLHVRGGKTETQMGKLGRTSEDWLSLLHIHTERT